MYQRWLDIRYIDYAANTILLTQQSVPLMVFASFCSKQGQVKIGDGWLLPRPRYPDRGWIPCTPLPFQRVTARSSTTALAVSVCCIVSMLAMCSGRFQAYSPATVATTTDVQMYVYK